MHTDDIKAQGGSRKSPENGELRVVPCLWDASPLLKTFSLNFVGHLGMIQYCVANVKVPIRALDKLHPYQGWYMVPTLLSYGRHLWRTGELDWIEEYRVLISACPYQLPVF